MSRVYHDYTGHTGPLRLERKPLTPWPMYSFGRPATHFWNGVANYLREQGMTDDQIGEKLMSKDMRWMLDHCDRQLDEMGYAAARQYYKGDVT